MIALDTNILVYQHRGEAPAHHTARDAVEGLLNSGERVAVPWQCVHEFLNIVTHPRIYSPPSPPEVALEEVERIVAMPNVSLIGEGPGHLTALTSWMMQSPAVVGPKIHDARIAAVCLSHGVRELWTADRDFSWFTGLKTRNPLVA